MKKLIILFLFAILFLIVSLYRKEKVTSISKSDFLLNTAITITLYDTKEKALLEDCFSLISSYENKWSRTRKTSEIYKLNQLGSSLVSDDTKQLIEKALYYSEISKGAFDLTIGPLTSLWNFTSQDIYVPKKEEIESAIQLINYRNISILENKVTFLQPSMAIDLGAIAKGFIADKVKEYLIQQGVTSAIINLGGNILCIGGKPDGTKFNIGIQKPFEDRNETIAMTQIKDKSVVSSGVYERFFTKNNKLYHHLLNPKTGYPYENELLSVTIISNSSVDGDGLSTTCFALGLEQGLALINELEEVQAVFITKDYELHYSDGFLKYIK